MAHLPKSATNEELIRFVDNWATLMEKEDYEAAFAFTGHVREMQWTPKLIREVLKAYGDASSSQKVTLLGKARDVEQRKKVSRWKRNSHGVIGEIWYDRDAWGAKQRVATYGRSGRG